MKLTPSLVWGLGDDAREPLDPRLLPLLDAIGASRSLAAAVTVCGVSYRAAWGLLRAYERKLGAGLAHMERGRGASLTPTGEALLAAHRNATRRLERILPTLAAEIGVSGNAARDAPHVPVLRIAASHDLALAALGPTLPGTHRLEAELSIMGSLHALAAFASGAADMAGFHVPIPAALRSDVRAFLEQLRARRDRLVRFADREQGLIVPRGNPARLRNFRDVSAKRVRFVNRQRGSGTRLIIDRLIADAGLDPNAIHGYATQEFTHAAVAATVASGGADAAFGLRAAAADYRLGFVPLVSERYYFAVRAKELERTPVAGFIAALASPAFAQLLGGFAGYDGTAAGTVVGCDELGQPAVQRVLREQ